MKPVYDLQVIREVERAAVARADTDELMIVAARGVSRAATRLSVSDDTVLALVGGGDNGGDALYAASFLARDGRRVRAAIFHDRPHSRALKAARDAGVDIRLHPDVEDEWLIADMWIDGLLGTGLKGRVRDPLAHVITRLSERACEYGVTVVAVDIPSGIFPEWHVYGGPVIRANHTVTMGGLKKQVVLPPAAHYAGSIEVIDLGLHLPESTGIWRSEPADGAYGVVVPGPADHKYTRGVCALEVGSDEYPGAGVLAATAASCAGPGMVRFSSDEKVQASVVARNPGIVTAWGRFQALLAGPGMSEKRRERVRDLLTSALGDSLPVVIDAGALTLVPDLLDADVSLRTAIMTPHAGEAAHLLNACTEDPSLLCSRADVEAHPLESLKRLCEITGGTVLLKGATTLVGSINGDLIIVPSGPAWMGVAGSGDVLSGIIVALCAQHQAVNERRILPSMDPEGRDTYRGAISGYTRENAINVDFPRLAAAGVQIHARAATVASGMEKPGSIGRALTALDIAEAVPRALATIFDDYRQVQKRRRVALWEKQ